MLLIRHSNRANNAVRTTSVGGELFVASVVICMILASFGDAVDPALFGEAGLEFAIFDFGGELSVLAMRHWHLLQLLLAGAVLGARTCRAARRRRRRHQGPAPGRPARRRQGADTSLTKRPSF